MDATRPSITSHAFIYILIQSDRLKLDNATPKTISFSPARARPTSPSLAHAPLPPLPPFNHTLPYTLHTFNPPPLPTMSAPPPSNFTLKRKIAVMGSRSVGKSSLVARYVDGPTQEIDSYHPTIEQVKQKTLEWAGRNWVLDVVDTAGQVSLGKRACKGGRGRSG